MAVLARQPVVEAPARRDRGLSKNEQVAAWNEGYGHNDVRLAPDPTPAVQLRLDLQNSRRCGCVFDDVWLEAVEHAVSQVRGPRPWISRREWKQVFFGQTDLWRGAYERTGGPITSLSERLLPDA